METSIFSNTTPSLISRNVKSIQLNRLIGPHLPKLSRTVLLVLTAKKDIHGGDFGGASAMVDNNMFTLGRRMHEMDMAEAKLHSQKCWMEWERKWYDKYQSDVCAFVGLLQILLMNSRPTVAIAMLVLFMSSVPASVVMLFLHLGGLCH